MFLNLKDDFRNSGKLRRGTCIFSYVVYIMFLKKLYEFWMTPYVSHYYANNYFITFNKKSLYRNVRDNKTLFSNNSNVSEMDKRNKRNEHPKQHFH